MNSIVRVIEEVIPGFAALVAVLKGKPLDSITLKDVIEVAREVYGDSTEFILEILRERLGEEANTDVEDSSSSSDASMQAMMGLALYL